MAWVMPLVTIAADIYSQNRDAAIHNRDVGNQIEQQRLQSKSQLLQGGHSAPNYASILAPQPRKDNGVSSALQLLGTLGKAAGSGGDSDAGGSLTAPPSELSQPDLLQDYNPDEDAQWKGSTAASTFGGTDAEQNPTVDNQDDRLTSRLQKRFSL